MWGGAEGEPTSLFHLRCKTLQPSTGFDLSTEIFVIEKKLQNSSFSCFREDGDGIASKKKEKEKETKSCLKYYL